MKAKRILSLLMTLALCLGLLPAGALALGEAETKTVPEWAVDDGGDVNESAASLQAGVPRKYDLRSEGLVTPVKLQNPWGSCWAFGGIAAAETSLLTAYGSTYERSKLDLSERHLAYFAMQPVTADVEPTQVGEGLYTFSKDENAPFDAGGSAIYVTTLFSQGVGPLVEEEFPYRGKDGTTNLDDFNADPEATTKAMLEPTAASMGLTVDEFLQQRAAANGQSVDEVLVFYEERVKDICETTRTYSSNDDWSIPETNENGSSNRLLNAGVVLKNGNVLPEYWNDDKTDNSKGKDAIKQELLDGRGVSILYYADQSGTYTQSSIDDGNQYNQYIDDELGIDHSVCIVGWDDDYAADNFKTEPPGKGAWIVKNSWGSTKDAVPDPDGVGKWNYGAYGIKEGEEYTGCFYLSYYDKTICQPETLEFSSNLRNEIFSVLQYDYMPATMGFFTTQPSADVVSAANVFQSARTVEIKSVSTQTSEANMRVTFAIYVIKDSTEPPTEDDKPILRTSCNFQYAGFHRLDLDQPIRIEYGDRVWVVTTASVVNDDGDRVYSASADKGLSKATAEAAKQMGLNVKTYAVAKVNPGESFLYSDGAWQDWTEYLDAAREAAPGHNIEEVDNFSIKLYGEPADPYISGLWVGDSAEVTAEGVIADTGCTKGTAELSFDEYGLPVLTLKDFVYKGAGYSFDSGAGDTWCAAICYTGSQPLTIKLEGENDLACTGDSGIGLYTLSLVGIEGDGDLLSNGSSRGISGQVVIADGSVAAGGGKSGIIGSSLTITDGCLIAFGGSEYGVDVGTLDLSAMEKGALVAGGGLQAIDTDELSVKDTVIGRGWAEWDGTGEGTRLELNDAFSQYAEYKRISLPAEKQCKLTLDAQNGETPEVVELWPGSVYVLPVPSVTPAGQQFAGWNSEPDGSGMQSEANDPCVFLSDVTLYGQWKPAGGGSTGGGGGGGAAPAANPVTVPASTAAASAHGTVKTSAASAKAGDKVVIIPEPEAGYEMTGVTVKDAKGNEVPVTKNADGTYSFTMPATAVTIDPVFEEVKSPDTPDTPDAPGSGDVSDRFTDVSENAWYHDPVQWAVDKGIMNGVSDDRFAPDDPCTRAMVVTMLWRLAGEPAASQPSGFSDVPDGAWYADAVAWAAETGAVNGTSETAFSPDTPVTREQLAAILYRYAQAQGKGFEGAWMFLLDYPDASEVSDWANEAMHWMVMTGVINGMDDGTLAPRNNATRAQIATMFMRFCEEMEAAE